MGNFCTNLRVVNEVVSDVLRAKYFIDIILFESKITIYMFYVRHNNLELTRCQNTTPTNG